MLLIVTERGDLTADWLILELERRHAPFLRLNTEDYPINISLAWRTDGAQLSVQDTAYPMADFDAIWYRRPVAPVLPAHFSPEQRAWAARESFEALHGLWRTHDALWVNHPDRNRLAESKPDQLRVAPGMGFEVPATIVTNDRRELERFLAAHNQIICKPLWDGQVPTSDEDQLFFTSVLDPTRVSLEELGPEPYLFQELVPKLYDVRVTVIGQTVWAVAIESQETPEATTDWRRATAARLEHRIEELPASVSKRCIRLCEHYGLHFGAIDLARRPDGGYTFFELNPNGQWAWVEQRTGLPLRSRLSDLLLHAMAP